MRWDLLLRDYSHPGVRNMRRTSRKRGRQMERSFGSAPTRVLRNVNHGNPLAAVSVEKRH